MWLWWNQVLVLDLIYLFLGQESLIGCLWQEWLLLILLCVITNCASFAVFHLCTGFVPGAKSAFLAFFFPFLLLWKACWHPESRSGSFHFRDPSSEDTLSPPHSIRPVTLPLLLKQPRNVALSRDFRRNLELILWLHGSFQLQTMLTKNGTRGPG